MNRDTDPRMWELQQIVITVQLPSSPLLACAPIHTGSHTLQRCSACTGLCCGPQLAEASVTSVAGTDWGREVLLCGTVTTCSQNTDLFQAPKRKQASVLHAIHPPRKASLQTDSGVEPSCTTKHVSSFALLSQTRDFFTQVTLESHRYAKTLSAMVKISLPGVVPPMWFQEVHVTVSGQECYKLVICPARESQNMPKLHCENGYVSRVIYILIVLIWGPSADSSKEAAAEKTSILLLNFTGSLYSGKHTWKAAQLYYILMNCLSTPGMCLKPSNWVGIK